MTLVGADFRMLRWPLAIAVLLTVAGVAVTVLSDRQLQAARQQREAAQRERVAAQDRVSQATDEEQQIRQNLAEYQKMVDFGMVGRTNRLNLIERISAIKNELRLFDMRYNIEPQKPLDYPGVATTGAMDLIANRMELDMQLLHEQDFLDFLHDLMSSRQAWVSIRHCTFTRNEAALAGNGPGLRSECTIDLINLVDAQS